MNKEITQLFDGLNNFVEENRQYQKFLQEIYGAKTLQSISEFFLSSNIRSLESMTTNSVYETLFTHPDGPFFQIDEPSIQRSKNNYEQQLVGSYLFSDPRDSLHTPTHTSIDVVCAKKAVPQQLKHRLQEAKIYPQAIVDFELLEYPHYTHEYYYGIKHKEAVTRLLEDTAVSGKDISKQFQSQHSPLYRDTEKIHIQFAAVPKKKGMQFIPVYVGIGTNEPYSLTHSGMFGKSRYLKYNFLDEKTGIEGWSPKLLPCSKETLRHLQEKYSLEHAHEDTQRIVWSILENSNGAYPEFDFGTYDENRFSGFLEYNTQTKHTHILHPGFAATSIDAFAYFSALAKGEKNIQQHAILRTPADITTLLNTILGDYEYYSATQLDPLYLVKKHGIDTCYEKCGHKLDSGDFNYINSLNIASDIYSLSVDNWHRLKCASLLYANFEKQGKIGAILEQILR